MINEITIAKLKDLYLATLQKSGLYLLYEEDEVIEYNIFEEFDIGVMSFLHENNLAKLKNAGLISNNVMEKSSELRSKVIDLQQSQEWNVEGVRSSLKWRKVLELSDEIKRMLE